MQGPNVVGLHKAVTLLGLLIDHVENAAPRCSASARQAVCKFQIAHQLPISDEVDETVAKSMNAMLAKKGTFDLHSGGDEFRAPHPSPRTRLLLL